jgi:hypothetical protein
MVQKFGKLSFVRVCDEMPSSMSHFPSGFDAIVDGTYSQLYGGTNVDSYALYQIRDGRIVNRISWYHEDQLTLLPNQDRNKAEELVEEYRLFLNTFVSPAPKKGLNE